MSTTLFEVHGRCRLKLFIIAFLSCSAVLVFVARSLKPSVVKPSVVIDCHATLQQPKTVVDDIKQRIDELVARQATASDPELIQLIRQLLDPPSSHRVKLPYPVVRSAQAVEIDKFFSRKKNGFYVECGAYDGQLSSNSLYLEVYRNWTGLLVEMDPYFYTQILGRSRNSWSIKSCLSPKPYVTQMHYQEDPMSLGSLSSSTRGTSQTVCFPLDALLVAMNRTTVDFFSLDVEGSELDILRTVPFNKLDIRTLAVEYIFAPRQGQDILDYMVGQGYYVHKYVRVNRPKKLIFSHDFIFAKSRDFNNSRTLEAKASFP